MRKSVSEKCVNKSGSTNDNTPTDLLKPELSFLNNMDLAHKNAWAPFSNYTLQLHMDFHGFKWLISFCACSFQISIIMFIFLYQLTGGDDHADQRGKACLQCFCDTFDSDRYMNSLTRGWMSMCSRSMVISTQHHYSAQIDSDILFLFSHALSYHHVFGYQMKEEKISLIIKYIVWLKLAWQWRYLTDKTGFLFIGTHGIS